VVTSGGTRFSVFSIHADAIDLCLFDETGTERRSAMTRTGGVWSLEVPGVGAGTRYGFRAHGLWDPASGFRFNPAKLLVDPYTHAVDGEILLDDALFGHADGVANLGRQGLGINTADSAPFVPHCIVTDPSATAAGRLAATTRPQTSWRDTVIYELHVKGFSRLNPELPPELRGTYAGLAHPASIGYLRDLGVTAVELLPVHQIATEAIVRKRGLVNYWGYNPLAFGAVHNGYGRTPDPVATVTEFGEMVGALHDAGIEVLLDVVYNHAGEGGGDGPTLSLRGLDNSSYYWLRADDRSRYVDCTGVGNTLRFGNAVVDQLVIDTLRWWVEECGVDGFRFDLASSLGRNTDRPDVVNLRTGLLVRISEDPVLSNVKLIAEPWDLGPNGYQLGEFPPGWTEWNDKYRDAVRDFWRSGSAGVRDIATRISGSSDMYADDGRHPTASINFVTAHDGFTLRDLVTYAVKHNDANLEAGADGNDHNRADNNGVEGETTDIKVLTRRAQTMRAMAGTLLLSTGVPMVTAGDELGRTQQGNNNAYCQDNEISWIDWDLTTAVDDHRKWFVDLLSIRKEFAVLRREHFFSGAPTETGPKDLVWVHPTGREMTYADWQDDSLRAVGAFLHNQPGLLWWLNGSTDPVKVRLPSEASRYRLLADSATGRTRTAEVLEGGDALLLDARSFVLLTVE
jgi:glycogen operon protein